MASDGRRVLKEGYLSKHNRHNSSLLAPWRRRYFRLFETELAYYRTSEDARPRVRAELTLDTRVSATNDQGFPSTCFVVVVPHEPPFYLQAESDADKLEWVSAVFAATRLTEAPAPPPVGAGDGQKPPPAPATRPERVLLTLTVVEARNLLPVDMNGLSDPYCLLSLIGKSGEPMPSIERKTDYVRDSLNPVWSKRFTIGADVDLGGVDAVQIDLKDYNMVAKHVPLGSVRVPLEIFRMSPASTTESEVVDRWFSVEAPAASPTRSLLRDGSQEQKRVTKAHGELHLVMSVAGPNLVDFFQSAHEAVAVQSRVVSAGREHTDNRLEVTVLAADGLTTALDKDVSNPFCELSLADEHGKVLREETVATDRKENTREPRWKGEHMVFGRVCNIELAARLKVRVLDFFRKECMGVAVVDLTALAAYDSTAWYPLQLEPGMAPRDNLGQVQLRIMMVGETRGERQRRQAIDRDLSAKAHDQSVEQLELENAQHLLHDTACKLDGARIPCAAADYRARHPRFYGINGCIQQLNEQIARAHRDRTTSDEGFQDHAGVDGMATLKVAIVGAPIFKGPPAKGTNLTAVISMDPPVCIEASKRTTGLQSPQKRKTTEASGSDARNGLLSKRGQAEVSTYRTKLKRNEFRSEKKLETDPEGLVLCVEVLTGHELHGADSGGYSDPYCTLTVTDRATGKPIESEKKRTAAVSKTQNPTWTHEVFLFGQKFPLVDAGTLLIHVKDRNSVMRSTPLGRVQIPLLELYRASIDASTDEVKAVEKRYPLTPEPWMDKRTASLGELCLKTELRGSAAVLNELIRRLASSSPSKLQSSLSFASFHEDVMDASEASVATTEGGAQQSGADPADAVFAEEIERGHEIRTMTVTDGAGACKWKNDVFSLSLSYPGMFSDNKLMDQERFKLHLRVHGARHLLGQAAARIVSDAMADKSADEDGKTPWVSGSSRTRNASVNAYLTVIPVLSDGRLESSEKQESLTVYDTRNPSWPEQEFVFGKGTDISRISYLSLHIYSRDLMEGNLKPVSHLLEEKERKKVVWLKRYLLHKLSASGEVDDDVFEILQFDQRVLAYRRCLGSGRFYPARVQRYVPLPRDEYEVAFESNIETISDIRDMFSVDVKGKIATIRRDGKVDVAVDEQQASGGSEQRYRKLVSSRQITPIGEFTASTEAVMARRIDSRTAQQALWERMTHKLSGLTIEVLSTFNLPGKVKCPGCIVTLVANPAAVASGSSKMCGMKNSGELTSTAASAMRNAKAGDPVSFVVPVDKKVAKTSTANFIVLPIELGDSFSAPPPHANQSDEDARAEREAFIREAEQRMAALTESTSALIQVIDQEESSASFQTVGYARIDFAALQPGAQDLTLCLVPAETTPYSKAIGSVFVRVTCKLTKAAATEKELELASRSIGKQDAAAKALAESNKAAVGDLSRWYHNMVSVGAAPKMSRIGHRQTLRVALTPTQNAQIDSFHVVLVVIMKRVVAVLREIRLLEAFESLPKEETSKFRHVHTVSSNPNSEWLGRMMNELSLDVRKDIVVHLEMELLDIAGDETKRDDRTKAPTVSREEWIKLRAGRQKALQEFGGFMMQDRTTAMVLGLPNCFTGQGMVSWIERCPPVLLKDEWRKYCSDPEIKDSSRLYWDNLALKEEAEAIQSPSGNRGYALQWLSALCAAGYVENVSSLVDVVRDLGKKPPLMEDRADRFYRIREVDMWARGASKAKSLSPLDLVQEMDCHVDDVAEVLPAAASTPGAAEAPGGPKEPLRLRSDFSKKMTPHCEGGLGMPSSMAALFLGSEAHTVLYPVAEKAQEVTSLSVLCDWKYCLFVPATKCMYVYDNAKSTRPDLIIVMTSRACRAATNTRYDKKGGWFDVLNAALYVRKGGGDEYEPMSAELQEKVVKPRPNGETAIEFKAADAQLWIRALSQAGVRIGMLPGQQVLLKQLDADILHTKCVEYETEFEPTDLEASFQRLLNAFFGHGHDRTSGEQDSRNRQTRERIRNELKRSPGVGDSVMAYYGMSKRLSARSAKPTGFTTGALYSGEIVRIRSPFSDPTYRVSALYDLSNEQEVPEAMKKLLKTYGVTDKAAWLRLPDALRDLFLLYDVEFDHKHEAVKEEGLLREQIRVDGGDLDREKVRERCTDLNLLYSSTDLEGCITRMVTYFNGKKPLGCLKVPVRRVSPYRVSDTWYSLAPEKEMIQKEDLGQIRIQLRLVEASSVERSKIFPALIEEMAAKQQLAVPAAMKNSPKRSMKNFVRAKSRSRRATPEATATVPAIMREPSFIKISIKEAHNLIIADWVSSDPYVQIILLESESDKEVNTMMKTDYKSRTLHPKWENQEFTLGKTGLTALCDKKAVLLRVMDHDNDSKDDPMGCVWLDFQRDPSGYVTELMLHCANADGSPATKQLQFDASSKVKIEAMLAPDVRAGMSEKAAAKNKAGDGKLGTLNFEIELIRNDNYVDPNAVDTVGRALDTTTSAEIVFEKVVVERTKREPRKQAPASTEAPPAYDWSKFTVAFQPFGDSDQRIPCDPNAEDLSTGNAPELSQVLNVAGSHLKGSASNPSAAALAGSALKLLGKTYDVTDVAYFQVQLESKALEVAFRGKFGHNEAILRHPEDCTRFQDEIMVLRDPNIKDWEIHLTVSVHLIGIGRGARIKRALADTFRIVGLTFDPKAMGKNAEASASDLAAFLRDVCKRQVTPETSTADVLMAQVRRLHSASRLHWRFTPQLLWFVFEYVLHRGDKDRVSFANAVALDDVLKRWNRVLASVEEAKSQLTGHLHGKFTPALIQSLFTDCDWTGFDLTSGSATGDASSLLGLDTRVLVQHPEIKYCSAAVDVRLASGQFIGATIIREYDDDHYDVAFCSGAKVKEEDDVYFSDDEDLPPLLEKETVFLCPIAAGNSVEELAAHRGRVGTVAKLDKTEHPTAPVMVSFDDRQGATTQWKPRGCLDSTWVHVHGNDVLLQLKKDDFVYVTRLKQQEERPAVDSSDKTATKENPDRPAKVVRCIGNGKYDVKFVDGLTPVDESRVPRARMASSPDKRLYDGWVMRVREATGSIEDAAQPTTVYDVLLTNGELVTGLQRDHLRPNEEYFPTDLALLGAAFETQLPVMDNTEIKDGPSAAGVKAMASKLTELWGNSRVVKVYAVLPSEVDSVSVRDGVTDQVVQAQLLEVSESKPRFVGQYHGYIKGCNLYKSEAERLQTLYAAKALERQQRGESIPTEVDELVVNNCVCLLLAPTPRVKVRGALRLSSNQGSPALFKVVLATFLSDSDAFTAKLQRWLRSECGADLPLNRKDRILRIPETHVCFYGKPALNPALSAIEGGCSGEIEGRGRMEKVALEHVSLDVSFELLLEPNDRGSLASSMADVYDDATRIVDRLKTFHCVLESPKNAKDVAIVLDTTVDMSCWRLEPRSLDLVPVDTGANLFKLEAKFTGHEGKDNSDPSVTMEIDPLKNPRVSVRDVAGKTHDLSLPIESILEEAKLRRLLVPFAKAQVASGPIAGPLTLSPSRPVDLAARSSVSNEAMYQVEHTEAKKTMLVSRGDMISDAVRVEVSEVSQMTLDKKMGKNSVTVEVRLVSSDFDEHASHTQNQKTPLGVTLSPQGEILKDRQGASCIQSATLAKQEGSKWAADRKELVFQFPSVDLRRVAAVRFVLKTSASNSTNTEIGMAEIPMAEIRLKELGKPDDDAQTRVVSILRQDDTLKADRVVGKMRLKLSRDQTVAKNAVVYARSLVSESDAWKIDAYELLARTLHLRDDKVLRGLLTSSTKQGAASSDAVMTMDPVAQEAQLQRLANAVTIRRALDSVSRLNQSPTTVPSAPRAKVGTTDRVESRLATTANKFKRTLSYTKEAVEDKAMDLGILSANRRLPWGAEASGDSKRRKRDSETVTIDSDLKTSTMRLRRAILALHQLYCSRLVPKLDKLYELDAQHERIDISRGEQLLRFFQEDVDDLDKEDQAVLDRVRKRLHVAQISQLLSFVMRTKLLVKVFRGSSTVDSPVGVAHVPIIDLLDQLDHDNEYELLRPQLKPHGASKSPVSVSMQVGAIAASTGFTGWSSTTDIISSNTQNDRVRLRIQLSFAEASLLEQAAQTYKLLKARLIMQHEEAALRINAAVVPAQRRRWMLMQGYLEQLVAQSKGKLHWSQTPVLLNRVWDVFTARKAIDAGERDAGSDEYEEGLTQKTEQYRAAVVEVHTRWANLQPKLEELLSIQTAAQIDAHRTPQLLEDIERSVEGFDIVLSTALQQVRAKWETLRAALEQLVAMQERNKLHLGLAPKLLKQVDDQCSRGLSPRHAEAVAAVQFRLKAITGPDGPLCELRLTVEKGLHWRRTHEMLLLLNEQCEGFSIRDADGLKVVQSRWEQVQEWLEKMVDMLENHVVDCTETPFLLDKMALTGAKASALKDKARHSGSTSASSMPSTVNDRPSPSKLSKMGSSIASMSIGKLSKMGSSAANLGSQTPLDQSFKTAVDEVMDDPGRLEGLAEWYAAEEARLELDRVPYHRITADADKNCWLQFSKDGKDTRLLIAEEDMTFTPANVRAALEDRGVIHKTSAFATGRQDSSSAVAVGGSSLPSSNKESGSASHSIVLTKDVLEEIDGLERALKNRFGDASESSSSSSVVDVLANPERVAELYSVIEDLGKTELLWKVKHAVNVNTELAVPTNYWKLHRELELRGIEGVDDVHNLMGSLVLMLQKEELAKAGVKVPPMVSSAAVKELTRQNSVGIVRLPDDMDSIQKLLQERGLDRKGDPVFMRGMRIGTQARAAGSSGASVSTSVNASTFASTGMSINTGLGIIDTQIEVLRKSLLMEALRKRNSLARTFPVASRVLGSSVEDESDLDTRTLEEMAEVDLSGDYMTLVERFQQLLIHEAHARRLASYAALDRCMRALVGVSRDEIVTKESIAIALADLKKPAYRLPVEAFTREELLEAADAGKILTPTDEMLARCPSGSNAKAMAHYAAVSYAAAVYQELKSFRERVDPWTQRCVDSFPLTALPPSVADSASKRMIIPRGSAKLTLRQSVMNWLLGAEEGSLTLLRRRLTEYQRQRLAWASAAVTLQNRWLQRGHGWCDAPAAGVGVKVLLQRLLLFETANKMHMVDTEALLREVDDKCTNLRPRERAAKEELARRYASNVEMLDKLVRHAEKCTNERKLHTEETPALLYAIDQVCVAPLGLNAHHREAYHVVTFHWLPHQKRLEELVRMHKEGTFSIHRTPELLSAMEFHTEGLAGSKAAPTAATADDNQQQHADKMDEIRGQRKMPSSRNIPRGGDAATATTGAGVSEADDVWKPLQPSSRVVQPLSPREKQMSWKVVTTTSPTSAASTSATSPVKKSVKLEVKTAAAPGGSPRRRSSLGDELKELLLSPSKWLISTPEPVARIQPDKYFPFALSLQDAAKPNE